jgi:hypothetical protein
MELKRGGPIACPRPCCVCDGGDHHWLDVCPDPDDPDDDRLTHEAYAQHELPAWYGCKHCDAWIEDVKEDH